MDKLGRAGARARREVVPLDERDGEPARGRVEGDACAGRAAADDEDVKLRFLLCRSGLEVVEGVFSRGEPVCEGDAGDLVDFGGGEDDKGKVEVFRGRGRGNFFFLPPLGRALKKKPRRSSLSRFLLSSLLVSGIKQISLIVPEERERERE